MTKSFRVLATGLLLSTASAAIAQQAPIVLPGAPGAQENSPGAARFSPGFGGVVFGRANSR